MSKIKFIVLFLSISILLFSSIPEVDLTTEKSDVSVEEATIMVIHKVWNFNTDEYKALCREQALSVEEFNLLAIIGSKSKLSMEKIWKWRKMKLPWKDITEMAKIDLDDIIPKSEKLYEEPYSLCFKYWREKGDRKKVFEISDYVFEKIGEVLTLSLFSEKNVDFVIDEIKKGSSFRILCQKYYLEKSKKKQKR